MAAGISRRFLLKLASMATLGTLTGELVPAGTLGNQSASAAGRKFTDWGWPLPYEQISDASKKWLEKHGWWPLQASWIVVWSGEEMAMSIMDSQQLLQKRGIEAGWRTFVAAGYSNEAFMPGRTQVAATGALGVLVLMANKVPVRCLGVCSPGLTHAATVPLDSPLKSLADLKDAKVLKRPAAVGTTTGSTNHFGFLAAAAYLGLKEGRDYTLRTLPPGDLATAPPGLDVYTIWEPHVSYSTDILKRSRLLQLLNPYYIYSGYVYIRREIDEQASDVAQAITDAYVEAMLWGRANSAKAIDQLMARPAYQKINRELITRMTNDYFFWPKPTVYYPFGRANGLWPKEEARISKWALDTGAIKQRITVQDWQRVRNSQYMERTFQKLGWTTPRSPAFLPRDFGPIGNLPYKPYGAELLSGPVRFPERGDLARPWEFQGKVYQP